MFIEKIQEEGGVSIREDSDLADIIFDLTTSMGLTLQEAITAILGRNYRLVTRIMSSNWADLGLQEPKLSTDEMEEVRGITV